MAAIAVKVKVSKLVDALTQRVTDIRQRVADAQAAREKFEQDTMAWERYVVTALATQTVKEVSHTTFRAASGHCRIEVTYEVPLTETHLMPPEAPPRPAFEDRCGNVTSEGILNEIENALRILALTDEEYVNTSTYKHVSKYL